jgi:toluene monooxygenase system ferredoxin subunit
MDGATTVISFHEVCGVDDLWIGDMDAFSVGGKPVLLVNVEGIFKAYSNICPHQDIPLVEGKLDGCVLTCRAHHWEFDITSGASINPSGQRLTQYPVRIIEGTVQVGDIPLPRQNGDKS